MSCSQNVELILEEIFPDLTENIKIRIEKACAERMVTLPVAIAQLGLAPDDQVVAAYRQILEIDQVQSHQIPENPVSVDVLNPAFLKSRRVFPISSDNGLIHLAMVDPLDQTTLDGVAFATGMEPVAHIISLTDWRTGFGQVYGFGDDESDENMTGSEGLRAGWADDATRLKDMASEAPVIRRVDNLLIQAVDIGASDIHVEPSPNATRIRFRVDGHMQPPLEETPDLAALLASRVKVMCDMDVANRRRPQDGRTSTAVRGRPIDLRVSTVPTAFGESLAIRLLDRSASLLDLNTLGFSDHDFQIIQKILESPKGIFLVTGPTGSGKTTTLYAALNRLRKVARKILTVEDPIEYFFDDINQVQVNQAAGVTFASALRSFLRQDPDIMMVGEIRDAETARIAVQAALTGHLVLSTLHTNDAVSAVARLKDLGVEDYLIAATLSGVTAQRLVRRLCENCREPVKAKGPKHFLAPGCDQCGQEGFKGRILISEAFTNNTEISKLIREDGSEDLIFAQCLKQDMKPLLEDGLAKALHGLVSLEDVYLAAGRS